MAMQTPVLSISIQGMCFSDVISMSRHKNFENFICHITIQIFMSRYVIIMSPMSCSTIMQSILQNLMQLADCKYVASLYDNEDIQFYMNKCILCTQAWFSCAESHISF